MYSPNFLLLFLLPFIGAKSLTGNDNDNNDNNYHAPSVSGNDIVDDFLQNVSFKLDERFEPIALPSIVHGFEKKLILVTVKGEAKLYEGWLAGFSSLHRNQDASLVEYPGGVMLKAPLGVSNLLGNYKGHVKFMNLGPAIQVTVKLSTLSALMYLLQSDSDAGARLTSLSITRVGEIEVVVEGLGVLDWILTPFNTLIVKTFKKFIWSFLERPVKEWLGEQIALAKISLR